MPNYKVHKKASIALAGGCAVMTWVATGGHLAWNQETAFGLVVSGVVAVGAYAGGTFFSPDLDIPSTPYNNWKLSRLLWLPYQIFTGHRSPVSHWPIMGAVIQQFYLLFMLTLLAVAGTLAWNLVFVPYTDLGRLYGATRTIWTIKDILGMMISPLKSPAYWVFIGGQSIGSAFHCIMDWADSKRRRHYQGQPMGPDDEDEKANVRGLWG